MKFTNKQELERKNLEWFAAEILNKFKKPSEADFIEYLAHSERGNPLSKRDYDDFNWYVEAKRWRGITIHEIWEDSFYGGDWTGWDSMLCEDDGSPIPEHIKDYIAREIFAGQDKELINAIYKNICQTKSF